MPQALQNPGQFVRHESLFKIDWMRQGKLLAFSNQTPNQMEKATVYVGIDISKDSFDVAIPQGEAFRTVRFTNDPAGFKDLGEMLPQGSCCVMEATGAYYCALAAFLHEHGQGLSVVNPLSVKYFARMRMKRAKTDKADCQLLSEYGVSERPPVWQPLPEHLIALRQEMSVLEQFRKQRRALVNQQESLCLVPGHSPKAIQAIEAQAKYLEDAIEELEKGLAQSMRDNYPDLFDLLQGIPGIGAKTAMALVVITQGFSAFANYKQLVAYVGLAPRIYESGKSVRGKSAICKMGMDHVRKLLYMCAQSARRANPACKVFFERLRLAGKPFKVALIAVAAKLLKQAFAIAKSGLAFQPNFGLK